MAIGPHLFNPTNITLNRQALSTLDNRQRCIEWLSADQLLAMNTLFPKAATQLITYREPSTTEDSPLSRGCYETLDYFIAPHRWRNN
eukprot:10428927-Prorocentrum_lima.AAC.1